MKVRYEQMKNIRQPPMIHHCNQTEYIQRGANLVQMAADACAAMYLSLIHI